MKDTVVGIGEALWDCLPEGRKLGGAPANFAYHVSQFGWRSAVVSAVGNDALGDEILQVVDKVRLSYDIARVGYPTGTVQVTLSQDGIPSYEICEDVAWDNIPWTEELTALAARNINLRQHFYSLDVIGESLRQATILKLNDEEIVVVAKLLGLGGNIKTPLAPNALAEAQCRELLARYPQLRLVVLTCGAVGSYVFSADETSYLDTPKVVVADTVGAGDSFTATFAQAILSGATIREAHRKAVAVSAYVCTQHGAMPKLPGNLK